MPRTSVALDPGTMPTADTAGPVLVADASADTRNMYGLALEAAGVPVIFATDGRDALVQIHRLKPSAIIADLMLPFIDAVQLCALIRNDSATAPLRVVVIASDRTRAPGILAAGVDEVLIKPVPLDALTAAVHRERDGGAPRGDAPARDDERGRKRVAKVRAHQRYVTRQPPLLPPPLKCPLCDADLQYDRSHVGGVSERHPEQWDSFVCATHGVFQYRHRTRKLQHIP